MTPNRENQLTDLNSNDPKEFFDEVTQNKIDRHLHDINDTISEEDIKNIKTDISSPEVPGDNEDNSETGFLLDGKKHKKDDDNRDQLPTTWNVID